jgi:hypothetical protein
VLRTDLLDRRIPWMRLLLQEGSSVSVPADLKTIEKAGLTGLPEALRVVARSGCCHGCSVCWDALYSCWP